MLKTTMYGPGTGSPVRFTITGWIASYDPPVWLQNSVLLSIKDSFVGQGPR